jgi:hypothetical protein
LLTFLFLETHFFEIRICSRSDIVRGCGIGPSNDLDKISADFLRSDL